MSTPSSTDGSSSARGLRDRPLGRVAILREVVLAAYVVSKSCGASNPDVRQDEAVEIAVGAIRFEAECYQIRFLRQGVQSQGFWFVSLWTLTPRGQFDKLALVQVNAETGRVAGVNNNPANRGTDPQCASPV